MKLAVCAAPGRADDPRTWSGTPWSVVKALQAAGQPHEVIGPILPILLKVARYAAGASSRFKVKVNWEVEPTVLHRITRQVQREAKSVGADAILTLGFPTLGREEGDLPIIYWGDATFAQRVNLAPHWQGLSRRTFELVEATERAALHGAEAVVMASTFALSDARSRYGLSAEKSYRVGFGASIKDPCAKVRARANATVRLLSVGVEWERKGIDRCVHIADALIAQSISVTLDVVGLHPPSRSWSRPYVTYHGFLDKRDPQQQARLDSLYRAADVFVLPTRNEPFGIAFAEAAAYGLPAIGTKVGGVPDVVVDGMSGILLSADSPIELWSETIWALANSHDAYARLSAGAIEHYRRHLTWEASVAKIITIARRHVA